MAVFKILLSRSRHKSYLSFSSMQRAYENVSYFFIKRNIVRNHAVAADDSFGTLQVSQERLNEKKRVRNTSKVIQDDSSKFGTLSNLDVSQKLMSDDSECDFAKPAHRKYEDAERFYTNMKDLVKKNRLKEALDEFSELGTYTVPTRGIYTFLIAACGKAGYTEKAFKLLRKMTDSNLEPSSATLTSLFNSCAQCPYPDYGLQKAKFLREKIQIKNWELNQVTYHAMIKAFGKNGDLATSFQIVDEMHHENIKVDVTTYSFLLMSCAADKETGFTQAVEVWRKMMSKNCKPNLFSFNLLLRVVRDCGVGPQEISCLLLQHWSNYEKRPYSLGYSNEKLSYGLGDNNKKKTYSLGYDNEMRSNDLGSNNEKTCSGMLPKNSALENTELSGNISKDALKVMEHPNKEISTINVVSPSILLSRPINILNHIDLDNVRNANDRLALIGGIDGFFLSMKKYKVTPDIKTFTLLLESLSYDTESEEKLLALLDVHKIRPDVDFFNILIKKRNIRKDTKAAKEVLQLLNKYGVSPDIVTFGVLALGCLTLSHATLLLRDMETLEICPNIEIIGALVHNASNSVDFQYLQDVLNLMLASEIKPNEHVIQQLEKTIMEVRRNIIDLEKGQIVPKAADFCQNSKKFHRFL